MAMNSKRKQTFSLGDVPLTVKTVQYRLLISDVYFRYRYLYCPSFVIVFFFSSFQ